MSPFLRNTLSVLSGIFFGSLVNLAVLELGGKIIPPPAGVNLSDPEGWKAALPLLTPQHFLFPFLAHALGTLSGALIAAYWVRAKSKVAWVVGFIFFAGGISSCFIIPAPYWFVITDLLMAYLPFAYLAVKIIGNKQK